MAYSGPRPGRNDKQDDWQYALWGLILFFIIVAVLT